METLGSSYMKKMVRDLIKKRNHMSKVYRIFQFDLLGDTARQKILETLPLLHSPQDVINQPGWKVTLIDAVKGRCYAVTYMGVEVAIMFKRLFSPVEIGPADPEPERSLSREGDAWIVMGLLGTTISTADDNSLAVKALQGRYDQLFKLYGDADLERDSLGFKLLSIQTQVDKMTEQLVAQKREHEQQAEIVRRDARKVQQALDRTRSDVAEQLLEILNVSSTASEADPANPVLKLQIRNLGEALKAVGVELITATPGQTFDPHQHHAVDVDPTAPEGEISRLLRVGAKAGDRVITPADVVVGTLDTTPVEVFLEPETPTEELPVAAEEPSVTEEPAVQETPDETNVPVGS